ncbi:MAG: hypothetical protein ACRDFW_14440 [bacterium]
MGVVGRISERSFEDAIECALLAGGPDACPDDATAVREIALPYGPDWMPGGFRRRRADEYDRALCLIPQDALDFIYATQPKEWDRLKQHYGADVKDRFLKRLAREVETRGVLDVLRSGIKDAGVNFRLAYFRPASRLTVDQALMLSVRANTPENARLTFDHVVSDRLQDMVDTNFKFYKRVTDDPQFAKFFLDWLFERFRKNVDSTPPEET